MLSSIPDEMTNFDGCDIPISKHIKILGVYFDKFMTFDTYTNSTKE